MLLTQLALFPVYCYFQVIVDSYQSKMFWLHNKFPIDLASLVKMPEYQPRPHKKNSANIQPSWVTLDFVRSSGLLGKYIYIYVADKHFKDAKHLVALGGSNNLVLHVIDHF